jgi:hypothetical protein
VVAASEIAATRGQQPRIYADANIPWGAVTFMRTRRLRDALADRACQR